jgi:hypothetical protein
LESLVLSWAQYWRYRELAPIVPPEAEIGMNPVQLVAGVGEFEAFTLIATLVPEGVRAVHDIAPQFAVTPASNTREMNAPDAAYGVTRTQSTVMAPPPVVKSLASASIVSESAAECVATTLPSTEKTTLVALQSIR